MDFHDGLAPHPRPRLTVIEQGKAQRVPASADRPRLRAATTELVAAIGPSSSNDTTLSSDDEWRAREGYAMLHRIWKGVVGDDHMYHSASSDGLTWTDQRQIRGRTSHGPALIVFGRRLHRAWKGPGDDTNIYHSSSFDGLTWTDRQPIPDAYTSHGPALAVYNDTLYLAYRGSNTYMYMSSLPPDGQWSRPRPIAGRTSHNPALSAGNGRLYCLWKGVGTDTRMFTTSGSSEDPYLLLPVRAGGWELEISGRTSHGPALTRVGTFCRLWKGEGTDARMFMSTSDHPDGPAGTGYHIWSPPQQVGGQTSHGPALLPGGGLYRLWKNSADDTMLISIGTLTRPTASSVHIEWTAEQPISGLTSHTPSLVRFGL